jgi:MFS family permease
MKHAVKYGLISGLVMVSSWWLAQLIFPQAEGEAYDFTRGEWLGYISMLLALTAVFVGVKQHRDQYLGGLISFKDALKMGLYIVLVASVIYVVGWMIYYPNFMPDFADQYAASQVTSYEASGLSEAEIESKKQELKEWMELYENPFIMMGMTFMEIFPVGMVVSLIAAVILKRKEKK